MTINKQVINSDKAPAALGPYSQAIRSGNLVFCSGQTGIDPQTGELAVGQLREQADQVFKNIQSVLSASGLTLQHIVKTTVFLAHMSDFAELNTIYAGYFGDNHPARSTVEVARLPKDALIEIEVIAAAE